MRNHKWMFSCSLLLTLSFRESTSTLCTSTTAPLNVVALYQYSVNGSVRGDGRSQSLVNSVSTSLPSLYSMVGGVPGGAVSLPSAECPSQCLVSLHAIQIPHDNYSGDIMMTSSEEEVLYLGAKSVLDTEPFLCVISEGDCGANVPFYRFVSANQQDHYSGTQLDNTTVDEFAYDRGAIPLCYLWNPKMIQSYEEMTLGSVFCTTDDDDDDDFGMNTRAAPESNEILLNTNGVDLAPAVKVENLALPRQGPIINLAVEGTAMNLVVAKPEAQAVTISNKDDILTTDVVGFVVLEDSDRENFTFTTWDSENSAKLETGNGTEGDQNDTLTSEDVGFAIIEQCDEENSTTDAPENSDITWGVSLKTEDENESTIGPQKKESEGTVENSLSLQNDSDSEEDPPVLFIVVSAEDCESTTVNALSLEQILGLSSVSPKQEGSEIVGLENVTDSSAAKFEATQDRPSESEQALKLNVSSVTSDPDSDENATEAEENGTLKLPLPEETQNSNTTTEVLINSDTVALLNDSDVADVTSEKKTSVESDSLNLRYGTDSENLAASENDNGSLPSTPTDLKLASASENVLEAATNKSTSDDGGLLNLEDSNTTDLPSLTSTDFDDYDNSSDRRIYRIRKKNRWFIEQAWFIICITTILLLLLLCLVGLIFVHETSHSSVNPYANTPRVEMESPPTLAQPSSIPVQSIPLRGPNEAPNGAPPPPYHPSYVPEQTQIV